MDDTFNSHRQRLRQVRQHQWQTDLCQQLMARASRRTCKITFKPQDKNNFGTPETIQSLPVACSARGFPASINCQPQNTRVLCLQMQTTDLALNNFLTIKRT
jgi:hypothetical protein